MQVAGLQARVLQRLARRAHRTLHQVRGQLVEFGACQRGIKMLRAVGVRRDERQVDGRAGHAGQLDLGLFGGLLQALRGHFVLAQVHAVLFLELIGQPVDDTLVKVIAAQMRIARSGKHFGDAVAHLDDGDVERTAAKVVDHDLLVVFFVRAVGKSRGRRLVDDALDLQAGDGAGILGGLALAVVEVRRYGDDRLGDLFAQIALGVRFQLGQNHGADLLRGVFLAVDVHFIVRAHMALDGSDGTVGVGDGLALCHLAHQALACFGEAHDGRRGARALGVGDDDGLAALDDGNTAVCGAKVDTNNLAHNSQTPLLSKLSEYMW